MSDDPFEGKDWQEYAKHVKETLIPMIKNSAVTMSLVTGSDFDPKMAIETGYMVLMDKPIITVVTPGAKVPNKLALVSDEIVEVDLDDSAQAALRISEAMTRIQDKIG